MSGCRFCGYETGWFTCGHHGCKRGTGKLLGMHNHIAGDERHYCCSWCGSQWRGPR